MGSAEPGREVRAFALNHPFGPRRSWALRGLSDPRSKRWPVRTSSLRAARSLELEYAEALRAGGAADSSVLHSRLRGRDGKGPFGARALRGVEAPGGRFERGRGANGSRSARCRELFGVLGIEAFWRPDLGVLRDSRGRAFGAEVLESFGALGAEALGSRYRGLFGAKGASSFKGSWCEGLHGGSRYRRLFGARRPESPGRAEPAWLTEQVPGRLGSSSRSAASETRWPSSWWSVRQRRGAQASGRVRATEDEGGKRHERVLPVSGGSGQEETWRSREDEEGSGRWCGLTANPATRDSAWSKASKSRRENRGSRFVGDRVSLQRQGGSFSRGGRRLCRAAKPLNEQGPQGGCGMKQAHEPQSGANRREAENA